MQASATRTRFLAGFLCEILVDRQKERPEPGGPRQIVIHGRVLRGCGKPRSTPLGKLDPVIRLFEGNFLGCLSDLAQKSRISHRLSWPRTTNQEFSASHIQFLPMCIAEKTAIFQQQSIGRNMIPEFLD